MDNIYDESEIYITHWLIGSHGSLADCVSHQSYTADSKFVIESYDDQ